MIDIQTNNLIIQIHKDFIRWDGGSSNIDLNYLMDIKLSKLQLFFPLLSYDIATKSAFNITEDLLIAIQSELDPFGVTYEVIDE